MSLPGTKKKWATKVNYTDKSGQTRTIYLDMETNKIVTNLTDYSVLDDGGGLYLPGGVPASYGGTGAPDDTRDNATGSGTNLLNTPSREKTDNAGVAPPERTAENNYGWAKKPPILSILGKVPGFVGLAAKVANLAINANNVEAENAARADLGMAPVTGFAQAKEMVKGADGYLGEADVNGSKIGVSIDGKPTAEGKPTLTPVEVARVTGKTLTSPKNSIDAAAKTDNAPAPTALAQDGVGTAQGGPNNVAPSAGFSLEGRTRTTAQLAMQNGGRNQAPDADISEGIQAAVNAALGPGYTAVVTSGKGLTREEQAGKKKASGRHTHGRGADFAIIGPNGEQLTLANNKAAMDAVAQALAAMGFSGIGLGKGYMGGAHIHADKAKNKNQSWARKGQSVDPTTQDAIASGWAGTMPTPLTGPVPMGRPDAPVGDSVGDTAPVAQSAGKESIAEAATKAALANPVGTSPAPEAQPIVAPVDPAVNENIAKMAKTISGELGSKTVRGILSGDPEAIAQARSEIAAIVSTMNNRAQSSRYASMDNPMDGVLTGNAYNSLMTENMNTTEANYAAIGSFVAEAVTDAISGSLPSPAPRATHYRAETIGSPAWENYAMDGTTSVGEHVFSTVGVPGTNRAEYSKAFASTPDTAPTPTSRPASTLAGPTPVGNFSGNNVGDIGSRVSKPAAQPANSAKTAPAPTTAPVSNFAQPVTPTPLTAAPVSPVTRSSLPPVAQSTSAEKAAMESGINVSLVSPEEYAALKALPPRTAPKSLDNKTSMTQEGLGSYTSSSKSYAPESNSFTSNSHKTNMSMMGKGLSDVNSKASMSHAGFSSSGEGAFGSALGSGNGFQSLAGTGPGLSLGQMGALAPANSLSKAAASFGGFSAGSLKGTASGLGTGLGAVGKSGATNAGSSIGRSAASTSVGNTNSKSSAVSKSSVASVASSSVGKTSAAANANNANSKSAANSNAGRESSKSAASASAGGGPSGGSKVLCGYFYSKGKIPLHIYAADLQYSKRKLDERTKRGYLWWAKPLVNYLDRKNSKTLDALIFPFTRGWVYEMAYRMEAHPTSTLWGRLVTGVGERVCNFIGRFVR